MNTQHKFLALCSVLLLVWLLPASPAAAVNIVTNPGFETGDLTGWTNTGDTSFSGVTGDPHTGSYAFFAGPASSDGYLSQTLTNSAGLFDVSFWLRNDDITGDNRFAMSIGGNVLVPEASQGYSGYTLFSFTNVSLSANALLQFTFYSPPSFFFLDDVSVESASASVPDAGASVLLLALSLAGLGIAQRTLGLRKIAAASVAAK